MSPRTSTTDHNDAAAASGTGDGDAATAANPAATTTGNVDVAAAAAGNGEVTTAVAATAPARNYPAGLRVLLVDANSVCLAVIAKMLRKCLYQVTTCTTANAALEMIRNRVEWFELVLSDVYMPDMDGFKLLECIGLEMEIPVIMMSSDERTDAILKGIIHGACDYLIKPVRTEQLQTIWQHVVRKKKHELKEPEQHSRSREVREQRQKRALEQGDSSSSRCEESLHGAKRNDRDEEMAVVPADQPRVKKPRVVWTRELHERFLRAVDQLGVEKAVPKKIQELMKSPNITRENVASHLQKYRLYLKKQVKDRREKGRSNSTFANAQEVSGRTGVVRFSNQNLPQSQANLSGPVRIIGAPVGMSDIDNIGLDAHIVAFSSSMQQENNIPMDCFTGVSGNKDLRQYEHSQSMVQPYQNMPLQFGEGTSGFHSLPSSQIMGSSFPGDAIGEQLNNSLMTQQRNQFSIAHLEDNMRMNLPTQSQSRGQLVDGVGRHQSILQLTSPNPLPLNNYVSHFSGISDRNASAPTTFVGDHVNASSYDAAPPSLYVDAQNANKAASSESDHLLVDSEAFGASSFMEVNDFNTNSYLLSELDQDDTQDWRWESANFSHQLDQLRDSKSNNNFDGEN